MVWIEAALNGPWTRQRQPGIPVTVDEVVRDGIACAEAGAAIIHVHAYDPASGVQNDDADIYAAIIEGIRAQVDVIVYPTVPFVGGAAAFADGSQTQRYSAIETLAARGLLEWAVVDPGSINLATFADGPARQAGSTYLNPGAHIQQGLAVAARCDLVPSYAIYEPGFLRLGAALAAGHACPPPLYRLMFSDTFTFGLDPDVEAIDLYLRMLERHAPGHIWMVAGLGLDVRPLIPHAIARGGHVRVGLEDAPFGTPLSNRAWVEEAVRLVRASGAEPATARQVRADLARQRDSLREPP
ncbi:3-keto-5-aminohexanoate cleavage protein [Azorhizobium oxalatiphilum]|uniref:3-keto-5-aminohexanoate cleavage protein n=1 Tax=Azorhizobium oxalatiphilum TaxID=980631 RepID=A0A917FMT6_9HYPH|nr:3-keto-5-aminohexanoate cleavage protein [Azorhizobium oxalatiphilum]GGF89998.1 3-keto-5-aminohexanoate cleavage protein [Azorhizobium oxalatiphilum]